MKKIIREVDQKRGIMQVTTSDERWYLKRTENEETGLPVFTPVPSVTWIAGYYPKGIGFYKWLADQGWDEAQAVKQAAGDKGSVVHFALERILAGEEFRVDTEVQDKSRSNEKELYMRDLTYEELLCVWSFVSWRKAMLEDYDLETIATETTVFSEIHGFAGTVDWVVLITPKANGKDPLKLGQPTPYIVDFKTSKQVWTEYEMQVSAYRTALENGENTIEKNGKPVNLSGLRTAILQVGYALNKDGYKWTEVEDCFDLFLTAQKIWRNELPARDQFPGFTQRDFPLVLSAATKVEEFINPYSETKTEAERQLTVLPASAPESPAPSKAAKKNGRG